MSQQKNKKRSVKTEKKAISLFEIFLMVISVVTFAYFVGEEFDVVRAEGGPAADKECNDFCVAPRKPGTTQYLSGLCKAESECDSSTERAFTTKDWFYCKSPNYCCCKLKTEATDTSGATATTGGTCKNNPDIKIDSTGKIYFIYGKANQWCSSTTYVAISSTRINREDKCGMWYAKEGNVWKYHIGSTVGDVDATSEGSLLSTWNKLAGDALVCWNDVNGRTQQQLLSQCAMDCGAGGFTKGGECQDWNTCKSLNGHFLGNLKEHGCTTAPKEQCCCKVSTSSEKGNLVNPEEVLSTFDKYGCGKIPLVNGGGVCVETRKCVGDYEVVQGLCVEGLGWECCRKKSTTTTQQDKTGTTEGLLGVPIGPNEAVGNIFEGFLWAGMVYTGTKIVGPMLGFGENEVDAGALALSAGVWVGKTIYNFAAVKDSAAAWNAGLWGAGVALVVFAFVYSKESQEIITFNCLPWQAPAKGNDCHKCNEQGVLPCTEYQCRSLGQACQILNKGTKQEKCEWVNENDVKFPIIEPLEDVLTEGYKYTPDNRISPPDRGVNIELKGSTTKCVKAFTPLTFGISTNEPAKCKLDTLKKNTFEEMSLFFSGGLLIENHSYTLSLPGVEAMESEGLTIQNDGKYSLHIRCEDANGNSNTADFVFSFCVEKGPDTTPPLVVKTSILSGNPIAAGQTNASIEVYVNEPVEGCKWDHIDQSYENMINTMDCTRAAEIGDVNDQGLYTCKTRLNGLKDEQENNFYFRCEDKAGNIDRESYKYMLLGTKPLVIDSVLPNGTIKDSTINVQVTLEAHTFAGYKDGEADCYYSTTGDDDSYIKFYNTHSFQHSQDLYLPEGDYEYFIRCLDLAGNSDTKSTSFTVKSDVDAPLVVRAYHEESNLKIITDKQAKCVYDLNDCTYMFDDGVEMTAIDNVNHYTSWNTDNNFYIKCQDVNGNLPNPDECSIIIRPYSGY